VPKEEICFFHLKRTVPNVFKTFLYKSKDCQRDIVSHKTSSNIMFIHKSMRFIECLTLIRSSRQIFAEYNQQVAKFHNLFISVRRSTCFRRVFRPSSGAQNCTYSVRHMSDQYWFLDHIQRRTTIGRTPLDEWSARRRDLYLTTHTTFTADKYPCPSGIRTHNLNGRSAAELRLRPLGHWDRRM